jgi:DNA-binding NtrC family response regulator
LLQVDAGRLLTQRLRDAEGKEKEGEEGEKKGETEKGKFFLLHHLFFFSLLSPSLKNSASLRLCVEYFLKIALNSLERIMTKILVVDDKEQMRDVLRKFLAAEGYAVTVAANGREALEQLNRAQFDLVLSDIKMPGMDGEELLDEILQSNPQATVILMTAFGSIEAAVAAIKRGATDYISKPFEMDEVLLRVSRALKEKRLERRVADLEQKIEQQTALQKIIGNSQSVKRLRQIIERIAPLADTVLITGETGTGKELVARALHKSSRRSGKPFIALDCSSTPETLIESELFGHERGTFTGATEARTGLFETAADGTLFLDEVETLTLAVQAKLLRVLQERVFRRVGGRRDIELKARVIAATNQDLARLVTEGVFRQDLFYRLNVIPLTVPPLRERREDIPEIVSFFLVRRARELNAPAFRLAPEVLQILMAQEWRGNVRELQNLISYVTALGGETINAADLPLNIANSTFQIPKETPNTLADVERQHILSVLDSVAGNRIQAASILGIDRRTLYNKLRQYNLLEE